MVLRPEDVGSQSRVADKPLMIAEILSPSTLVQDLGDKRDEYLAIGSLQAYLVLDALTPQGVLWVRQADGFAVKPLPLEGREQVVEVPALSLRFVLADIYPA